MYKSQSKHKYKIFQFPDCRNCIRHRSEHSAMVIHNKSIVTCYHMFTLKIHFIILYKRSQFVCMSIFVFINIYDGGY